jgi:hypothetical protein
MMEGDLLEVSLDETHHIWRILHASAPTHKQLCYDVLFISEGNGFDMTNANMFCRETILPPRPLSLSTN